MRIATFNINGINSRLQRLTDWLTETGPDIVCLQELKTPQPTFPDAALSALGYRSVCLGEPRWNGVAILSRIGEPIVTRRSLPGAGQDQQGRYIEAAVAGILVCCLYLPNGNPRPGPKFDYKMRWCDRLVAHAGSLVEAGVPAVLCGDYNIVPTDRDIYNPASWRENALLQPEPRQSFADLLGQAGPMLWLSVIRTIPSGPSGPICGTPGSGIQAGASTICCSVLPSPDSSLTLASTGKSGRRPVPVTMPPSGSNWWTRPRRPRAPNRVRHRGFEIVAPSSPFLARLACIS